MLLHVQLQLHHAEGQHEQIKHHQQVVHIVSQPASITRQHLRCLSGELQLKCLLQLQ
jgi:hypothetical protein